MSLWIMVLVVYESDSGNNYNVAVSSANQTPGGFDAASAGAVTNFPRGWKMRHVYGLNSSVGGGRHTLPCAKADNTYYRSGGTFTVDYTSGAQTFDVQGRVGEKRTQKL